MKMRDNFKRAVVFSTIMLSMGFAANASAVESYYLYGDFTISGSAFMGGYDVDTYGNTIYVNRGGYNLDVYTVTLSDSDADGDANEPDQHPDNVGPDGIPGTADDAVGPMEARTLTYETTYNVPLLDTASVGEIYAASDRVYFLGEGNEGIYEYIFASNATNLVVDSPFNRNLSHLGRASDGTWYASSESRDVWSWAPGSTSWTSEFTWGSYVGGGHGDGLEVVQDPDTGIDYVYVSDMYADYIGQYVFGDHDGDATTADQWFELNTFEYPGAGASVVVEGMGFGALGHFWATGSNHLYEVGGGALGGYLPPDDNGGDHDVPEPGTLALFGAGLLGLSLARRRRRL